ncbi:hypothetical protein PGT21_006470 [Puccinia graminis f. sp. tritici]|uniref:Alpha-type protein kinase domain-containing protein n=1 Tax=Puccinia graminis f. sp. tritici TaxID=56615 RepID=A0A5B0Q9V5_PUCGR|nr:hypothetical protein PGT21_006470 [Puccinia graminis f. sp. tritici]
MELFLEKHKCNKVCKALELPDLVEIPWVPPPSAPDNFANDLGHFCRATVNTAQSTSNNPQTACEISQSSRALINARLPPPRTPTPTPLQKGRAIEPAPQGGAGLIARPSESCFRGKTGFRGAGRQTRPS